MTSKKCLWLIDGGYIYNAQRSVNYGYNLDYLKLRNKIEKTSAIWRAYYLNSTPSERSEGLDNFHNWLRSGPPDGPKIITKLYELKTVEANRAYCQDCKRRVEVGCSQCSQGQVVRQQQKGVDVGLATLALTHLEKYDALLLSSGDSDLLDAIEFLSEQGKRIVLLVFRNGVSTELQCRADEILWVDEFAEEVEKDSSTSYSSYWT
ncbi:MAG: NYN domain-containing protein [Chloroflexota bacterium]|nr:NYN domain-containing protein [Chloroflexota bacterium]MDE2841298.1 NYN domain-containing protein [Chloroflexota bacterium]MDE2931178.1 NYN domain-containing protein [Chloroflexota bacterium]